MKETISPIINFLKLIRWQNLLIIALTQYLFRYAILMPIIKLEGFTFALSSFDFAILVISTVLIASAGFVINDYFDIRIDHINNPEKVIVGRHFSRRKAMFFHTVLSITAVILGAYVSYKVGSIKLATINIIMATLLWMYSLKYKAYMVVGNVIVSFATAMTIIVVWLFDMSALHHSGLIIITHLRLLNFFLWIYVIFAFAISMIREIIKDVEDIEGDRKCGCSTIPVVIGINRTKYVLLSLVVLSVGALAYIVYKSFEIQQLRMVSWYLIIAVILPLLYMGNVLLFAKRKEDYGFLSSITKFIMIAGVLSMLFVFFKFH